jgi:signal transduction histidine kinase
MNPINILMVDDQPAKLLAYEAMLSELGENLIKANTARDALTRLLHDDIAVVLMDVSMPEMDGFELAAMIRQHPRCQRTAIIFVSAIHMSDMDRVRGYETGAVDYVSVPVIPEILRAKIRIFIELHRKTEELKRLNDELEARVKARTDDLEASLVRLRESEAQFRLRGEMLADADRRKDEFLAMLAHELRNPLAPIRNAVEVMRRTGESSVELEWIRDIIDRQVTHLVRLVDDLLDASRITRGKLVLSKSTVELARLVSDALETVRSPLEDDAHEFVVKLPASPVFVDADAVRLTQVFLNLLSNAIKFTPVDGKITLSVERAGTEVEIRVTDTGRGMGPEELPHVFEMFYQGDSSPGEKSGLGLGLTLVQNLVGMHGGNVSAQSSGRGKGSEFLVRLPIVAKPRERSAATASAPVLSTSGAQRILVVDDNRDAVELLAQLLRLVGSEVEIAYDGAAAVKAVAKFKPEIVLLDIGMPILDGYAAAEAIRRGPNGAEILLIAMTGWGQADDRRRALDAGFDAHLVKPASIDALLETFASLKPRGQFPSKPEHNARISIFPPASKRIAGSHPK